MHAKSTSKFQSYVIPWKQRPVHYIEIGQRPAKKKTISVKPGNFFTVILEDYLEQIEWLNMNIFLNAQTFPLFILKFILLSSIISRLGSSGLRTSCKHPDELLVMFVLKYLKQNPRDLRWFIQGKCCWLRQKNNCKCFDKEIVKCLSRHLVSYKETVLNKKQKITATSIHEGISCNRWAFYTLYIKKSQCA